MTSKDVKKFQNKQDETVIQYFDSDQQQNESQRRQLIQSVSTNDQQVQNPQNDRKKPNSPKKQEHASPQKQQIKDQQVQNPQNDRKKPDSPQKQQLLSPQNEQKQSTQLKKRQSFLNYNFTPLEEKVFLHCCQEFGSDFDKITIALQKSFTTVKLHFQGHATTYGSAIPYEEFNHSIDVLKLKIITENSRLYVYDQLSSGLHGGQKVQITTLEALFRFISYQKLTDPNSLGSAIKNALRDKLLKSKLEQEANAAKMITEIDQSDLSLNQQQETEITEFEEVYISNSSSYPEEQKSEETSVQLAEEVTSVKIDRNFRKFIESPLNEADIRDDSSDSSDLKSDFNSKFEQQIQELIKRVMELTYTNFDLETRVSQGDQLVAKSQQKFSKALTQSLLLFIVPSQYRSRTLEHNEELKLKCDTQIDHFLYQKEKNYLQYTDKIAELENIIKKLQSENDALNSKLEKEQAINNQKLEFLYVQLEQERNQHQEEKLNYDRMLKSIQLSQRELVIGKEEATKQLQDLKDKFQVESQNMQGSLYLQIAQLEKDNRQLSENCKNFELDIQLRDADFRKENEILRKNFVQEQQESEKLQQTCKEVENQHSRQIDDVQSVNSRYQSKLHEQEKQLEEKDRLHEQQLQEKNSKSEQQLQQLKQFQIKIVHFESQISLREQRIDALEKYLNETKETLNIQQSTHAKQVEALQWKINSESSKLTDEQILDLQNAVKKSNDETVALIKKYDELKKIQKSDYQNLEQKLRQAEIERAELGAREQSTCEQFQLLQKEKKRIEQDTEMRLGALLEENMRQLEEVVQKQAQKEVELKEVSRRYMQSESEYDKQKALQEQQIEFITERNKSLEDKEKQLALELKQQKMETSNWKVDQKQKFEQQIQDLLKNVEELTDTNFDLETRVSQGDQLVAEYQQKLQEYDSTIKKELQKAKETQLALQKQNEELKLKCDTQIDQVLKQKEQDCLQQADKIAELQNIIKKLQEENDAFKSKLEKDQAINNQKLEVLQVQLKQERNQRQEEKRNHDRMLKSIQSSQRDSVISKEETTKQLDDLKDQFQTECQNMQGLFDSQIAQKEKEIRQLSENCQKFELEIQLRDADFRKEVEILRENFTQAEQERDKLQQTCKELENQHSRQTDDINSCYHSKMQELEQKLEEKERLHEQQLKEINFQSEELLQQLKQFFESEKQRLEQHFNDEKDRNSHRMNEILKEHEQKLCEEQKNHEDEMEIIQSDLNHAIEENKQVIAHFESEISLREQRIDASEKYLSDKKETLDRQQSTHTIQVEALQGKINSERRELTDKIDALTQKITRKELTCTTLENQKEALRSQIVQRDKQFFGMKDEAVKERADLIQRYQELKVKIEEKEDELTQRKIGFERERALNQQQIQFTEQKANDLNTQLDRTVQRYEDRIKMDREELQNEIKDKSQKLQAEKQNADAKFDAKSKECDELETKLQKEIAKAEKEKQILILKQQELEQEHNQRQEEKRNYDRMLKSIQQSQRESVIGNEEATKQLNDLKDQFQADCRNMQGLFDSQISQKDNEIRQLQENCKKFEQEIQKHDADFRKENEILRENFAQAQQERDKLSQTCKELETQHSRQIDDVNLRYQGNIQELEINLEEKERLHELQLQKIKSQSEEHFQKLKQFYESEKQRLEQRNKELDDLLKEQVKEKDHLKEIIEDLRNQNSQQNLKCSELEQTVLSQDENIKSLLNCVENSDKKVTEQSQNLQLQANQISKLNQEFQEKDAALIKVWHALDDYKARFELQTSSLNVVSSLKQMQESERQNNKDLLQKLQVTLQKDTKLSANEQSTSQLESSLKYTDEKLQESVIQIKKLNSQLLAHSTDALVVTEEALSSHSCQEGVLMQKLEQLGQDLADEQNSHTQSIKKLQQLAKDLADEQNSHTQTRKKLEQLAKEQAAEKDSHTQTGKGLEQVKREFAKTVEKNFELQKQLKELQSHSCQEGILKLKIQQLGQDLADEQDSHTQTIKKLQKLAKEQAAEKDSYTKTGRELEQAKRELANSDENHFDLQRQLNTLQSHSCKEGILKLKIQQLGQDLADEQDSNTQTIKKLQQLAKEQAAEKDSHTQTGRELEEAKREITKFGENNFDLQRELIVLQKEIDTLKVTIGEVQAEAQNYETKYLSTLDAVKVNKQELQVLLNTQKEQIRTVQQLETQRKALILETQSLKQKKIDEEKLQEKQKVDFQNQRISLQKQLDEVGQKTVEADRKLKDIEQRQNNVRKSQTELDAKNEALLIEKKELAQKEQQVEMHSDSQKENYRIQDTIFERKDKELKSATEKLYSERQQFQNDQQDKIQTKKREAAAVESDKSCSKQKRESSSSKFPFDNTIIFVIGFMVAAIINSYGHL